MSKTATSAPASTRAPYSSPVSGTPKLRIPQAPNRRLEIVSTVSMSMVNAARRRRKPARIISFMPPVSVPPCPARARLGTIDASVLGAVGSHLFPSRTQQLSPPAPKILGTSVPGKIGQGRDLKRLRRASVEVVLLFGGKATPMHLMWSL